VRRDRGDAGRSSSACASALPGLVWMIATMSSWTAGAYLVPRYGSRLMLPGLALLLAGVLAAIAAYHAPGGRKDDRAT
jgi:hypothetical protein